MAELSLRGHLEVVVHLHTFLNIDLFQQGLYQKVFAVPSEIIQASEPAPTNHLCLTTPHILPGYSAFCSKVVLIRYSEEELTLDDSVIFSLDTPMTADFDCKPLVMEVELLFSDVLGNPAQETASCELPADRRLKSVSTVTYLLHKPCAGLCEYLQINFDSLHFSTVSCTVYTLLTKCVFALPEAEDSESVGEAELFEVCSALFSSKGKPKQFVGSEAVAKTYAKYVLGYAKMSSRLRKTLKALASRPNSSISLPVEPVLLQAGKFMAEVCSHSTRIVVSHFLTRMKDQGKFHTALLQSLLSALRDMPKQEVELLAAKHKNRMAQLYTFSIVRSAAKVRELPYMLTDDIGEEHSTAARMMRSDPQFQGLIHRSIESTMMVTGPSDFPILFEDAYLLDRHEVFFPPMLQLPETKRKKHHLIILVHGFGGSSFDVRKLKNQIIAERPEALVYCAHSNEDEGSDGDILIMGRKLAIETQVYISDYFPGKRLRQLSFIGHSMGGLVIRAALPFMSNLKSKLHLYMSLSTPHLGYIRRSSRLVDAGLWVLKKIKSSLSLNQVTLKDSLDPRKCALYLLSKFEGLGDFTHVMLLSSYQDNYAPFESARIQLSSETARDSKLGEVYQEMARNILSSMRIDTVRRVDVNFDIEGGSVDSMIGRAAHIQFLESETLMQAILVCFQDIFRTTTDTAE